VITGAGERVIVDNGEAIQGGRRARPRIVIVGCGFAGAYCAQALERRLGVEDADIFLIDRQNYFVFYPLLIEAGTGDIEPRHSVVSIRSFLKRERFVMAEVVDADFESREVLCRQPALGLERRIAYDHLVIALGSVANLPDVPGLREFAFPLKSLADAVLLRDRAIEMLELAAECEDPARRASLLHFVIVGANFTGAEMAGALEDLLDGAVKQYRTITRDDVRITLIDRGERILSALDPKLSQYALENLRRRGVQIRLRNSATEIGERYAVLQSGETLATETVIWTAGIAPPPLVARTGLPVDARGYILCERDLRVKGMEHVWGIGDAAVNIDANGSPYPATAQHAVRQGAVCAANIARALQGRPTKPCNIRARGSLAALGRRSGVAEVFGLRFSGFIGWWLWRTVYLLKMPGFGRKLRVLLEWNVALLSRRDYVQLGIRPHQPERRPQPGERNPVRNMLPAAQKSLTDGDPP
jgi:NADH:ubiquinone reductase (H+-translocating)